VLAYNEAKQTQGKQDQGSHLIATVLCKLKFVEMFDILLYF